MIALAGAVALVAGVVGGALWMLGATRPAKRLLLAALGLAVIPPLVEACVARAGAGLGSGGAAAWPVVVALVVGLLLFLVWRWRAGEARRRLVDRERERAALSPRRRMAPLSREE